MRHAGSPRRRRRRSTTLDARDGFDQPDKVEAGSRKAETVERLDRTSVAAENPLVLAVELESPRAVQLAAGADFQRAAPSGKAIVLIDKPARWLGVELPTEDQLRREGKASGRNRDDVAEHPDYHGERSPARREGMTINTPVGCLSTTAGGSPPAICARPVCRGGLPKAEMAIAAIAKTLNRNDLFLGMTLSLGW